MDEIDVANRITDLFTQAAIDGWRRGMADHEPSTGQCRSCDDDIEPARLAANPHAKLCADCAADAEIAAIRLRRRGPA